MATYKKTGNKSKSRSRIKLEDKSTTAEVFNTLDETASKSEQWIIKNQKVIFTFLAVVVIAILGYLGYQKYIKPKRKRSCK